MWAISISDVLPQVKILFNHEYLNTKNSQTYDPLSTPLYLFELVTYMHNHIYNLSYFERFSINISYKFLEKIYTKLLKNMKNCNSDKFGI